MALIMDNPNILEGEVIDLPFVPVHRTVEAVIKSDQNGQLLSEKTALIFGDRVTSFGELNKGSNRLARTIISKLKNHGKCPLPVSNEHVICPFISTCDTHVYTWLAIAKTGVGIMPLTPVSSADRSQMMVHINPPICFLVDRDLEGIFKKTKFPDDVPIFYIQDLKRESTQNRMSEENLEDSEMLQIPQPNSVFFLGTTGGSTGIPKIVPTRHMAAINALYFYTKILPKTEKEVYLTHALLLSDFIDTFASLINGGPQVILTEEQHKNPQFVVQTIDKHKITRVYFFSPSLLANILMFLKIQNDGESCKSLKSVCGISETMQKSLVEDFMDYFSDRTMLYNGWGMMETGGDIVTIENFQTASDLKDRVFDGKVSIGKPLPNTNIYILDNDLKFVGPGEMGNLCVSGDSLFTGYLKSQTPNLKRNPYTQKSGHDHIFITGDYARIVKGRIIFEGRSVHHVKIRGFRIHTGEIGDCITNNVTGVLSAVVLGLETSGYQTELVAFYTVKPGHTVTSDDVTTACKEHLEEYKVPVASHLLETNPTKEPLDKIDVQKLREIHYEHNRQKITSQNITNRDLDPVTDALFTAVAEAFNLPKQSLSEDLSIFDIGGNSINIVWVWRKVNEHGYDVTINDILACRTLNDILSHMHAQAEHEQQKEDGKYTVVNLFDQEDAQDVVHLIAMDFCTRNDIVKSVGIDYETFYDTVLEFWDSFRKSNFSRAVRDSASGKYLAVSLFMLDSEEEALDMDALVKKIPAVAPLIIFNEHIEKPMKDICKSLPGKNAHSWFFGVDQELNLQETIRVMKILDEADIEHGRQQGIKRFCTTAMHPVTKATGEDAGWISVYEPLLSQICHEGQKVFLGVGDDFTVAAQMLSLDNTNEPFTVREKLQKYYAGS